MQNSHSPQNPAESTKHAPATVPQYCSTTRTCSPRRRSSSATSAAAIRRRCSRRSESRRRWRFCAFRSATKPHRCSYKAVSGGFEATRIRSMKSCWQIFQNTAFIRVYSHPNKRHVFSEFPVLRQSEIPICFFSENVVE